MKLRCLLVRFEAVFGFINNLDMSKLVAFVEGVACKDYVMVLGCELSFKVLGFPVGDRPNGYGMLEFVLLKMEK